MFDITRTLKDGCPPQMGRGMTKMMSCHIEVYEGLHQQREIDWQNTECQPTATNRKFHGKGQHPHGNDQHPHGKGQHPDYYRDAEGEHNQSGALSLVEIRRDTVL